MEEKRGLSMDEMEKVSGGTGEAYGIDTDGKNEKTAIPDENQFHQTQPFGFPKNHPVYCSKCRRLLGYSAAAGTTTFKCDDCNINNY